MIDSPDDAQAVAVRPEFSDDVVDVLKGVLGGRLTNHFGVIPYGSQVRAEPAMRSGAGRFSAGS